VTAARIPLVEDAALTDLAWETSPPPVAAWCRDTAVAVVGSFSKLYWDGLRVGFVRASEPVALRFARVKATHDLGTSVVSQLVAERLLRAEPEFTAWRRLDIRARYEALASALREHLPSWVWSTPAGGLSIWARLPGADATAFAQAALRHGVAVAAQGPCSCSGEHPDRLRLSFAPPIPDLVEGVRRLATAWASFRSGA
jgi:DNA-binding transcriptional MocR family regulator